MELNFNIDYQQLFIICILLFAEYILVFLVVMVDLYAGIRKAKIRKETIKSDKLKRTTKKLSGYYAPMFGLTIVDSMQMFAVWYLHVFHEWNIPIFPIMTLIGAIGVGLIEVKSILERAEDKVKIDQLGNLVVEIAKNKDDVAAITAGVVAYLQEKDTKNKTETK